ncbi:MAG: THUMP domain-containing protein [Candidatus Methanomethylophilaceae archaeon]|nr:THUMP domain-containing protein [Candidatus Methanomethylophilaceae archaeon]MDY0224287.1 THUMP domain-containing protein [Candidatus Methanomethylophilaceae archaeon]
MAVILVRYAEIGLKSTPVRTRFENRLKDNMLTMLAADRVEALVKKGEARYYVETDDVEAVIGSLRKVFGIASLSVAEVCSADLNDICKTAAQYSLGRISEGQSFAVRARREGNHHPFTSMDVGREAGSAIFIANEAKGIKVDLSNPDIIFYVEVRNNKTYIFASYVRCHAGLPIGTQGRVVAEVNDDRGVLSAWLMMKRGCKVYARGTGDIKFLVNFDPDLKDINERIDDPGKIYGFVRGTSLKDLETVDVSKYTLPVYFPTIGMTDKEVEDLLESIKIDL